MTAKSDPPAHASPVPQTLTHAAVLRCTDDSLFDDDDGLKTLAESTAVAKVMSQGIVCISADASLDRVTEMLLERDIGSAPVVDAAWRPVGIVSKTDLLKVLAMPALKADDRLPQVARPKTVGEIAQSVVLSLHEASPVSVASAIMAYEGVHRLPVVNADGQIVGVVSSLDIVRWVARCTNDESATEHADAS